MASSAHPSAVAIRRALARVRSELDRFGVLLSHDASLPSATGLIAGEPIRGSWWGHPQGKLIYETMSLLGDEVAWPKLVGGKDTLLHRRLWPALVRVATARSKWQMDGLSGEAAQVLRKLRRADEFRSDQLAIAGSRKPGQVITELERRLLVYTESRHTESGHHARVIMSYEAWQARARVRADELPELDQALASLSEPVAAWVGKERLAKLIPWPL